MSKVRAIIVGVFIWILGAGCYSASYLFPFLDNLELQANLVLAIVVIPTAWLGASLCYRKKANLSGQKAGAIVVITAISLDAMITVPYLIVPNGGSYRSFFGAPAFWLIAAECFLVIFTYWNLKEKLQIRSARL